jgi:anti-sigma28 factor (negative regulator of flagellin synthesis)
MTVNNPNGTGAGGVSDQVQLSSLSSALDASQADSHNQTAKLAQLSAVVSAGNYQVDADVLSGGIIRDALGGTA